MKSKKFNKLKFLGTAALMSMTLMTAVPMITYAQANPEEETEEAGEVITSEGIIIERIQDEAKHSDEKETDPYTKPTDDDYEGILTPEGNLTLVDDLDEAESEELQYMTVTTRDGSYFYIIVDRSGKEENVYFLNQVDARDLFSILSDEEQEEYADIISTEGQDEELDIIIDDTDKPDESVDSNKEKKTSGSFGTLIAFIILGGGALGAYYFLKIKKDKEKPVIDEELEFYDDDEYESEVYEEDSDDSDLEDADIEYIDLDEED